MPKKTQKSLPVAAKEVRFSIELAASGDRAWQALIKEIALWWPKDFHAAGSKSRIILEPRLGGRLYEDAGSGNGLVWYQVIAVEAPRSILLSGFIAPPFGGPATSLLRLSLQENGAQSTSLEVHDALFGHVAGCDAESGWRAVFGGLAGHLK